MLTFQVDFNDQTEGGQIVALTRLATGLPRVPRVGDRAMLRDAEGNRCEGRVERVDGALAYVVPAWDSWSTAEDLLRKGVTVVYQHEGDTWRAELPSFSATGETREMVRARVYEYLRGASIELVSEVDMPALADPRSESEDKQPGSEHRFSGIPFPSTPEPAL